MALIDHIKPLSPFKTVDQIHRETLKHLARRAHTVAELRRALVIKGPLREVVDILAHLERNTLAQPCAGRVTRTKADQLWELHPLFLTRVGQQPTFWSPTP